MRLDLTNLRCKQITTFCCLLGVLLLGSYVLCRDVCAESGNLLRNGDFELPGPGGVGKYWRDNSGWANVSVRFSQVSDPKRKELVQKIQCDRFVSGAVEFLQPGIPVKKGMPYKVTLWMRGRIDSLVQIQLRERGKPYRRYINHPVKVHDKWTKYSFVAISRGKDSSAYFMLRIRGEGVVFVDDVSLEMLSDSGVNNLEKNLQKKNLIANGSFEVGPDRWGIQFKNNATSMGSSGRWEGQQPASVIDDLNPQQGLKSLRISLPKKSVCLLTTPYMQLKPGQQYTFSCWLRSDKPKRVEIGIAAGKSGLLRRTVRKVQAGKRWQRYVLQFQAHDVPDNAYRVKIVIRRPGMIWLDSLQLVAGPSKQYQPASPVEVGLSPERTLIPFGEDARFTVLLSSESSVHADLLVQSIDFWGAKAVLYNSAVALLPGKPYSLNLKHVFQKTGYYKLVAQVVQDGQVMDEAQKAVGILPAGIERSADSPFGIHAFLDNRSLEDAKKIGASWLRLHTGNMTKWFAVEPQKGMIQYYDAPILYAEKEGFHILGLLETSPRWASSAPSRMKNKGKIGFRSYAPDDLKEWGDYVYQMAKHYKGAIDYWEVWNEPNTPWLKVGHSFLSPTKANVYTNLLRVAYRMAKKANPNAVIIGGAGSGIPPWKWVKSIFQEGAYPYMDILSFHNYAYRNGLPGHLMSPTIEEDMKHFRLLMKQYGKGVVKPVWDTESGLMYPRTAYSNIMEVAEGYSMPADEAPQYYAKNMVDLLSSGISRWFYFGMFMTHNSDFGYFRDVSSMFEWDGAPRPLAVAYAIMSWILGDAQFQKLDHPLPDVTVAEFIQKGKKINIMWTDQRNAEIGVSLQEFSNPSIYDLMGRRHPVEKTGNGKIRIKLSQDPLYLVEGK